MYKKGNISSAGEYSFRGTLGIKNSHFLFLTCNQHFREKGWSWRIQAI